MLRRKRHVTRFKWHIKVNVAACVWAIVLLVLGLGNQPAMLWLTLVRGLLADMWPS
jgi:hypothetical protein